MKTTIENIKDDVNIKNLEFAELLGIGESTVRKYANLLEDEGYSFKKEVTGARVFTKKDYQVYKDILDFRRDTGVSVQQAIRLASDEKNKINQVVHNPPELSLKNYESSMNEMKTALQDDFKEKLAKVETENVSRELKKALAIKRFRASASEEWDKKPIVERVRRVGLFGLIKEEDQSKKQVFINKYIDKKLIEYHQEELDYLRNNNDIT